MAKKRSGKRGRRAPKTVLRLPDLDQAKSAVLNSLTSADAKRGYRHAMDEPAAILRAGIGADVIKGADMWMIQLSDRTGFALEALAKLFGRDLIATSRPSRVSRARYTAPIPPAPIGARIS